MNPEIVEVVARAIAAVPTWDGDTLAHDLTREELYAAAQAALTAARPAIMEEERAAVVAWLRGGGPYNPQHISPSTDMNYQWLAECIERGDHLTDRPAP